ATRAGVTLVAAAEVDGMRLLASLAFQGYGAAVLPASAVQRADDERWRAIRLTGTSPRIVGVAIPRRAMLSAPARAVLDAVIEVTGQEAPQRPGLRAPSGGP
ncbi:MAG TPA: LysR family transcriptional regulator substrate-binding protein, partial [Acidimicrobiales bacterium]